MKLEINYNRNMGQNNSALRSISTTKMLDKLFLVIIIVFTILGPGIKLDPSLPSLRIEDCLIVALLTKIILRDRYSINNLWMSPNIRLLMVPFIILSLWIGLVTIINMLTDGFMLAPKAIIYFATTLKGPLICMLIVYLCNEHDSIRLLVRTSLICMMLQIVLLSIQYYDLFGIGNWLTELYREKIEERHLRLGARTVGSYGNPNASAIGLLILATLASAKSVFHQSKLIKVLNAALLLLTGAAIVVFTGSRTGLAGFLTITIIPVVVGIILRKRRARAFIYLAVMSAIIIMLFDILASEFAYLTDRFAVFKAAESLQANISFSTRQESWADILNSMELEIITGSGIIKVLNLITDSGYITVIALGGFIGLVLYLFVILSPMFRMIFLLKHNIIKYNDYDLIISGISSSIALLVCSIAIAFYGSTRIWATYCVIIGISLAALPKYRSKTIS